VELRHHDDDPEKDDVDDDRGDDDAAMPAAAQPAVAPAAAAAPAPAAAVLPAAAPAATQAISVVEGASVQGWTYAPPKLTTTIGTTLTWTNTGAEDHTVTSDDRTTFDSRNLGPNATFSFTPTAAGTFAYHCAYHPWMNGTITVTP
jgi:plastocyanin